MEERIDIKPHLKNWLKEWTEQAKASHSKMKFVYANALKSLASHTGPIYTHKECIKIKYFGEHFCIIVKISIIHLLASR